MVGVLRLAYSSYMCMKSRLIEKEMPSVFRKSYLELNLTFGGKKL